MNRLSSIMSEYKVSRKALSLSDKLRILKVVDDNPDQKKVEVARQLNLPISTLNTLIYKRKEIEEHANLSGSSCAKRKRFQVGRYRDMEIRLAEWIDKSGANHIPLNGPILIEKAKELAVKMCLPDQFTASNGWLHKFKLRFDLHNKSLKKRNKGTKRKIDHRAKSWLQKIDSEEEGDHRNTEADCLTGTRETLGAGPGDQIDIKEETSHLEELNAGTRNSDQHLASVKIEIYDTGEDVKSPGVQQEEPPVFVTIPGRSSALPVDVSLQQHNEDDYSFPFTSVAFQEPSTSQHQHKIPVRGECERDSEPQFQFVDVDENKNSLLVLGQVQGKEITRKELPSTEGETAELFSNTLNSDSKPYSPIRIYNPTSSSTLDFDPVQSSQSSNSQLVVCYQPSHQCSPATVSEFCPANPVQTNGNPLKALSPSVPSTPCSLAGESHIGQTTHDTHYDPGMQETSQINDVQVLHRRIWELEMQIKTFKEQIAVRDEKKCGPLCQLISMETLQAHLLNTGFGAVMSQKSQESLPTSLFPNGCTAPIAIQMEQTRNSDGIPRSEEQSCPAQEDSQGNFYGTSIVTEIPATHQPTSITALGKKQNTRGNKVSIKVLRAQLAKKIYCYTKTSNGRFDPIARKKAIVTHNMTNREKKAKSALQAIVQHLNSRVPETVTQPSNST